MKIFIQLASYRDPELSNTIDDILKTAKYPENISFGICHQYGDDEWDNLDKYKNDLYPNIRIIGIPYKESRGACWARSLTQSLYNNEDFTLQLDSHSRMEPLWDTKIFDLYDSLGDEKAILSTYPCMFTPGQTYDQYNKRIYICHVYGMTNGFIRARPKYLEDKSKPVRAISIAAGFIFHKGSIINEIKYDPDFYFTGEEAAMALRFFTAGYNLYHPNINLVYHYYTRPEQKKHWSDHSDHWSYTQRSYSRLNCLLGRNSEHQMGDYGLGKQRTIEDWRLYSGIDYIGKKMHTDALDGIAPPYIDHNKLWIAESEMLINKK